MAQVRQALGVTRQIADTVTLNGEPWTLAEVSSRAGDGSAAPHTDLLRPSQKLFAFNTSGLEVFGASTACWRGYRCHYAITTDNQLVLRTLDACPSEGEHATLFGVRARPFEGAVGLSHRFDELDHQLSFTGGILIVRDPMPWVYRGYSMSSLRFHERTLELSVEAGAVTRIQDVSDLIQDFQCIMVCDDFDAVETWTSSWPGLSHDYGLREHPRDALRRRRRIVASEAETRRRARRREAEGERVRQASLPLLEDLAEVRDGVLMDGRCADCGEQKKLRVCAREEIVVCLDCWFSW